MWALLALLLWAPAAPAEERTQSAEQLIEQVMQQRALKALLTEELEVLRLRAELRRLRGETEAGTVASGPNAPPNPPAPTSLHLPQVVALWEDGDGRVASVSAPAAEGEVRRLRILREGEEIAIGGRKFRVRRIGPEGVRVRIGDAKDETLLPY